MTLVLLHMRRVLTQMIEGLFFSCGSMLQVPEVELRSGEDLSVLTLLD